MTRNFVKIDSIQHYKQNNFNSPPTPFIFLLLMPILHLCLSRAFSHQKHEIKQIPKNIIKVETYLGTFVGIIHLEQVFPPGPAEEGPSTLAALPHQNSAHPSPSTPTWPAEID
ncbi:hypothetical protein ACJIZ3_006724 [Penstemon smallii]|uniref:Uncharacterized protein n=1 Tax=Penstemon smallii TaxID=265156 RepID=A0ABD3S8H7_9LAMI